MTVGVRGGLSFQCTCASAPVYTRYIYARFPCLRPAARLRSRRPRCLDVGPCFAEFGELARKVFGRFLTTSSTSSYPPSTSSSDTISGIAFIKRSRIPVSFNPLFYGYRDYANTRTADVATVIEYRVDLRTFDSTYIDCSYSIVLE